MGLHTGKNTTRVATEWLSGFLKGQPDRRLSRKNQTVDRHRRHLVATWVFQLSVARRVALKTTANRQIKIRPKPMVTCGHAAVKIGDLSGHRVLADVVRLS